MIIDNDIAKLTCYNTEEIVATCSIDFDVPGTHEMFVSSQSHHSMLLAIESDQSLAVASTLFAQTQTDATPAKFELKFELIIDVDIDAACWLASRQR